MRLGSGGNQLFIAEGSSRQPPAVKAKQPVSQRLNHRLAVSAGQMMGRREKEVRGKSGDIMSEQKLRTKSQTKQKSAMTYQMMPNKLLIFFEPLFCTVLKQNYI